MEIKECVVRIELELTLEQMVRKDGGKMGGMDPEEGEVRLEIESIEGIVLCRVVLYCVGMAAWQHKNRATKN